ncbi:MAG: 50S ribosomal protein L15 [Panacagrimonas sp.]
MKLNDIKPAKGSKKARTRVGRGMASGLGKTCGRGHKGQRARKGGRGKLGFEGGQMPIQRRLPKRGFRSPLAGLTAEVRLGELQAMKAEEIDLAALKAEGVISPRSLQAKIILSGSIERKVSLKGLSVTKGARQAITAAGGNIAD